MASVGTMETTGTLIVGAGPAGLATAACLARRGAASIVLEREAMVGSAWHRHYERLHLHTNKSASGLPHRPMPRGYPRYPSRDQVAAYLADYARQEQLDVRLGVDVISCERSGSRWQVDAGRGSRFAATHLVIATGMSHTPFLPEVPAMSAYEGRILHSADYDSGSAFRDQDVLVVGFGNSAGEIALDLAEQGARAAISVRSPSVVVPRDIAGIPILTIARWLSVLPPRLADRLSAPLLRVLVGNVSKVGIPQADWGPLEQIATTGKIPLLDIGTMAALRSGAIVAKPGIARFTPTGVEFSDGSTSDYDAVVFGTGYSAAADRLLAGDAAPVDARGMPSTSGRPTEVPNLYFCGFHEPPTGRLREIGIEAERIAELVTS